MTQTQSSYAVMFIDFVGSTKLYELLGDMQANAIIDEVISAAAMQVHKHRGVVIKTIGDELMCRFDQADDAFNAACAIQASIDELPVTKGFKIALRIGLHHGPALLMDDGDLFGDAVNVAARISGLSRARQVLLSAETVEQLSPPLKAMTRLIDHASVKGKAEKIAIYQALWEPHDVTFLSSNIDLMVDEVTESVLVLQYEKNEFTISSQDPCLMFGRSGQCDLVIDNDHASRRHARIEYRRGKYILIDQSTNGTFVTLADGKEVYLRREEITLWGKGVISIGTLSDKSARACIQFSS